MDLEGIPDDLMKLGEQVNSLDNLYTHLYQQVLHNETVFWTVIFGVFAIIGIALYFIAKSIVQNGVEKGIRSLLDDNKLKLDKKNPEIIGTLKLNNSENDDINIRLVKLKDEPILNIESDKNNAAITINHKEIITEGSYSLLTSPANCCIGAGKGTVIQLGKHKLIELVFNDLKFALNNKHVFSTLPLGHWPASNIRFHGTDDQNSNIIFDIDSEGQITVENANQKSQGVRAYVVFMVHE